MVEGAWSGVRGGGESRNIGREIDFFIENSEKMAYNKYCFRPISHIKVHYGKHAPLRDQNERNLIPNA